MSDQLSQQIESNNIPKHVAIIMDGNGRWAENHGKMRVYGHVNGVDSVREALEAATELNTEADTQDAKPSYALLADAFRS